MKNTYRFMGIVIVGLAAVTAATAVVCEVRRKRAMKQLLDTANEGYETAHDIIYPNEKSFRRAKKLRYGPIYPGMH